MRTIWLALLGAVVLSWFACGGETLVFPSPGSGGGGGAGSGGTSGTGTATASIQSTTAAGTCGDGVCSPGEASSCPSDCAPACGHSECEVGDALEDGCNSCVSQVCAEDPYCCEQGWDSQCIGEADTICGTGCCGNGQCEGQTCDTCPEDCGECVCGDGKCEGETCETCADDCGVCPSCKHSVCETGDALDTQLCRADCVTDVCQQDPTCCGAGEESGWSVACQKLALQLCQQDPCVAAVCKDLPACCSSGFNATCVAQAQTLCNTPCDCSHGICEAGDALKAGCEPCAAAVCATDPYCCDTAWDGICVAEVASVCGIVCGGP
jgi:hypothetical protein